MIITTIASGIDVSIKLSIWVIFSDVPIYRAVLTGFADNALDKDFACNNIPEIFTEIKAHLLRHGVKIKQIISAENLPQPSDIALEMIQRLMIYE